MTSVEHITKIRQQLNEIKLRGLYDLNDNMTNLDDILSDYKAVDKIVPDLHRLDGKGLQEALTYQASEYHFFRMCVSNLRALLEVFEALHRHERGKKVIEIRKDSSRDLNNTAINQVIDGNEYIFGLWSNCLKVKEVYDRFLGTMESYNQRGYALNNITRAFESQASEIIL